MYLVFLVFKVGKTMVKLLGWNSIFGFILHEHALAGWEAKASTENDPPQQQRPKERLTKLNPSCGAISNLTVYTKCYLMHTWCLRFGSTFWLAVTVCVSSIKKCCFTLLIWRLTKVRDLNVVSVISSVLTVCQISTLSITKSQSLKDKTVWKLST